jgi:hypothetical protein
MFVSRALRRVFVSKGSEVKGGWRKLCDEELINLALCPFITKCIEQGWGTFSCCKAALI